MGRSNIPTDDLAECSDLHAGLARLTIPTDVTLLSLHGLFFFFFGSAFIYKKRYMQFCTFILSS